MDDPAPHDPSEEGERGRRRGSRREKIPDLIAAAKRARDDETALLLLQKAKQLDPASIDIYLLRAEIYERRGDDQRELIELKEALEADPTSWMVRLKILNLEYPKTRNLRHAGGIVRDLIWQKSLPERLFNAGRRDLRSESELGHDEALLGHLGMADRKGYGTVELVAVDALASGDVYVLNGCEPWLERFGPDGALVYGIDLWLTENDDLAQGPSDVAVASDGSALVAEPRAGRILRFGPDGAFAGTLGRRALDEPCSIAATRDGPVLVLCAGAGALCRLDPGTGRALGKVQLDVGRAALLAGSVAAGPDGTAYVRAGEEILVISRSARRVGARIPLPRSARSSPGKTAQRRSGVAFDAARETLLVTLPARGAVARIDLAGREVERIGGKRSGGEGGTALFKSPCDVAVDATGTLAVADFGNARVVRRSQTSDEWTPLIAGTGWKAPK